MDMIDLQPRIASIGRNPRRAWHRAILALVTGLVLATGAAAGPDEDLVTRYNNAPKAELGRALARAQGGERAVVLLFLAINDPESKRWTEQAYDALDSLRNTQGSPFRSVLLGTAAALRGRDARPNVFAAGKWLDRSLELLDEGVAKDPTSPLLRTFRIRPLVSVPSIFGVDGRLDEDAAFLRATIGGREKLAGSGILLALASIAERREQRADAEAYWKLVTARTPKALPTRRRHCAAWSAKAIDAPLRAEAAKGRASPRGNSGRRGNLVGFAAPALGDGGFASAAQYPHALRGDHALHHDIGTVGFRPIIEQGLLQGVCRRQGRHGKPHGTNPFVTGRRINPRRMRGKWHDGRVEESRGELG